jgi:ABC-type Fe3+-hydroxamate transport system substrate-binding protein
MSSLSAHLHAAAAANATGGVAGSALVDAIGTIHRPVTAGDTPRIVSLVPSVTELICDLGLAHWLVGRTGFCIHPAEIVAPIAKVGGTKDVNLGKLRQLQPTHVVVNIDENEKPTVEQIADFVPNIIVTHPVAPEDNLPLYRLLGAIFGAEQRAEALCEQLQAELALTRDIGAKHRASTTAKRVLYCIWQDPWMTVSRDTYIARMLALVGWQQWQAPSEARYPAFRWSEAIVDQLDEVLLSSEPYRFIEDHADALERQLGKPVRVVDGEMLSWYGSRAIAGLRYLRELAAA